MGRSYSLHVSSKKHALTNRQSISGAYNHNYRKYLKSLHYNKNQIIELIPGACRTFKEFKQVFNNHFKNAVNEYNSKQTKKERIIKDYFNKVENDLKKDVAVEIIIQVADLKFWKENVNKRDLMNQVFKEQLEFLKQEVPELIITNATVHQDEASPHMHVIGIPTGYGFKQGMTMQCSKTRVFTQSRLLRLQEVMRENAEILMKKYVIQDFEMDAKQQGRNHDYTKEEYIALKKSEELRNEVKSELKQNNEIKNQVIAELNNEKIKELENQEITKIINKLKNDNSLKIKAKQELKYDLKKDEKFRLETMQTIARESNFTEDEIKEQAILLYSENKENREEILESLKNDEIFQEEMKEEFGKQVIKDSEIIRVMSNNTVDYLMQDFEEEIKSYDNAYDFVKEIKETDKSEFIRLHSILDTINFFKIFNARRIYEDLIKETRKFLNRTIEKLGWNTANNKSKNQEKQRNSENFNQIIK